MTRAYSKIIQIIVRLLSRLTGKGGGKFTRLLPKGQNYLVTNYCGDLVFNIDTTYPMESSIWLAGVYEVTTTNFLKKVIRKDDILVDVGANCGAITLLAGSLINQGKIYAFEPSPDVHMRLKNNINANPQLKKIVKVFHYGLGRNKRQGFYYEDPHYRGNGALQTEGKVTVEIISLDEWVFLEKLEKIDLIKIDVEGMEYDVLLGGKAVLEKYQPIIYFETLPIFFQTTSYTIKTIYEFLAALGYKIINPKKPYQEVSFNGPYPPNSVAIPNRYLNRL